MTACDLCLGSGTFAPARPTVTITCPKCGGTGQEPAPRALCPACHGLGIVGRADCATCTGAGTIPTPLPTPTAGSR